MVAPRPLSLGRCSSHFHTIVLMVSRVCACVLWWLVLAHPADAWAEKTQRRKSTGTGRMRYLRTLARRFKNGFRERSAAPARVQAAA